MPERAILIRDRKTGVLAGRQDGEPIKLRVCRVCGRAATKTCDACGED